MPFTPLNIRELPKISKVWLQPSDIRANPKAIFRANEKSRVLHIDSYTSSGVYLDTYGFVVWGSLKRDGWQWSIDNGITWKKASKYVDDRGNPVNVIRGS